MIRVVSNLELPCRFKTPIPVVCDMTAPLGPVIIARDLQYGLVVHRLCRRQPYHVSCEGVGVLCTGYNMDASQCLFHYLPPACT